MRKILRGFRCAALVGAALLGVVSARAEQVYYRDSAGEKRSAECYVVENFDPLLVPSFYSGEWYAVKGKDINRGAIKVSGSAHLILCDGASLTANGSQVKFPAIILEQGASLTIYGQDEGTGKLVAIGGERCAGIGCRNSLSEVHGAGDLTICGGNIVATGGRCAAGIGGSMFWDGFPSPSADYGNGGKVEIYGMMKNVLVSLGWDENKIYDVGGYWYYEGKNSVNIKKTIDGKKN